MVTRVEVSPDVLQWACARAGGAVEDFGARFPKLEEWIERKRRPTLKQLEAFAKATHTPLGYLFLPKPPVESLPIPDLRTVGSEELRRPSPELLDTVHLCQRRQDWYRDYAQAEGQPALAFVGSASTRDDVTTVATSMRASLELEAAGRLRTWEDALRHLVQAADALGVLVMVSGVVGNNTSRPLDPDEFRGFALSDPWAPLVFVNGRDAKAAQMFTLAHELAHIWLGDSGVDDVDASVAPHRTTERWCNAVAAELLVPLEEVRAEYRPEPGWESEKDRLAKHFKVSTLVVLRRLFDAGVLDRPTLNAAYRAERARWTRSSGGSGGDFYRTQAARLGERFARALIHSTLEGGTTYRDALRLVSFNSTSSFEELGRRLGVG